MYLIKDFSFRNLKHTAMSYLAQDGATAFQLQAPGGHNDLKGVQRYAHLNSDLSKRISAKSNFLRLKIVWKV